MDICYSALFIVAAGVWHIVTARLAPRLGLVRPNFAGTPVNSSYGIAAFGYFAAAAGVLAVLGAVDWPAARLYLAVMGSMWALGLLDDIFGSRDVGGFGGHFRKLVFERKLTTGAVKALGGGVVGVLTGWALFANRPWMWAGTALVIPLAANTLNLFDLRPGRAVAAFFAGMAVTCITALGGLYAPWLVIAVVVVALAFAVGDARARAMMGDSWSNALGAALGLTMAKSAPALVGPAIAVFAAVQLYSEKHSISSAIERNPVLRALDRRLGVR